MAVAVSSGVLTDTRRARAAAWIASLHDDTTEFFARLDGGGQFDEDAWQREGGGGGLSRMLADGATFEKAGINRSIVDGILDPAMAERLDGRQTEEPTQFFAAGMSLVVHPRSPMIPTVHLNVRYLELASQDGRLTDAWFGGGTDLTPTYPFPEDAVHFHRSLEGICARYHPRFYPEFKAWCDRYFTNAHRGGEARGIGGVFFDQLRPNDENFALGIDELFHFTDAVGRSLAQAYQPIVERRRMEPHGERERRFQLQRRGRYVEFNLLHDRGTTFGLQSNARVESVLMSLPPLASWEYVLPYPAGSFEARLLDMLRPREWVRA